MFQFVTLLCNDVVMIICLNHINDFSKLFQADGLDFYSVSIKRNAFSLEEKTILV